MNPRWLVMAKRWAQNPPSAKQVMFIFGIVAVCIGLYLVERTIGWPAWLTPNPMGR